MRIIVNPGANLNELAIERYNIEVMSQQIVVDGVQHDTRDGLTHAEVDAWVAGAKVHPYLLGTPASEFIRVFREQGRKHGDAIAVLSARNLIGSYDGAVAAKKALDATAHPYRLEVFDTSVTDVGNGLFSVLAGELFRQTGSFSEVLSNLEAAVQHVCGAFTVDVLDNLVEGGRAGFVKAQTADFHNERPVIAFAHGDLKAAGMFERTRPPHEALLEYYAKHVEPGQPVWAAIAHGGVPDKAKELENALRRAYDLRAVFTRPYSTSVYLHAGRDSVVAFLIPINELPHRDIEPFPDGL